MCVSDSKETIRESKDVETAVPPNNEFIWDEPLTTESPFISKNLLYPLICAEEETTESPFISKKFPSICAEDEITPSTFNLSFTFESKFVIESAFTWDEPLITFSVFNFVFTSESV